MAGKRKYRKRKGNKKYKGNSRYQPSQNLVIGRPLLPETQKVMMRYSTRIQIDPTTIRSGVGESASNPTFYTFSANNLNDPDVSSTAVTTTGDGALNHQPRMYDDYMRLYGKATVLGSKINTNWHAMNAIQFIGTGEAQTTVLKEPSASYCGLYKMNEFGAVATPVERFDDLLEQNKLIFRRMKDHDKSLSISQGWSLTKDKGYIQSKAGLILSTAQNPQDEWGAPFNTDIGGSAKRYFNLLCHPMSTLDNINPAPLHVEVSIDYIVLLSGRHTPEQS